ncbi:MAG: phage integrase SAM-like domain-containing protein [Bacteroidota bacterium]
MPKVLGTPEVRFNLQRKADIETTITIVFRYRYQGNPQVFKYSPGLKIRTKHWDFTNHVPLKKPINSTLRGKLNDVAKIVVSVYNEFEGNISTADFRNEMRYRWEGKPRPAGKEKRALTMIEFIDEHVKSRKEDRELSKGGWNVLNNWKGNFKAFCDYKKKEYDFEDITPEFKREFAAWAYDVKGLSINYLAKGLSVLRQFMSAAKVDGLHNNTYFDRKGGKGLSIKKVKTDVMALSHKELQLLFDIDLSSHQAGYSVARDRFLLGAYTGQRYQEYGRITKDHVVEGKTGKDIRIMAMKGKKYVRVPLHPNALAILQKHEFKIPKLSRQKLSDYIKEVAKMAGVNETRTTHTTKGGKVVEYSAHKYELIGSHTSRRTWATLALIDGMPRTMVRAVTGHSNDKQLDAYIDMGMYLSYAQLDQFRRRSTSNGPNLKVV